MKVNSYDKSFPQSLRLVPVSSLEGNDESGTLYHMVWYGLVILIR